MAGNNRCHQKIPVYFDKAPRKQSAVFYEVRKWRLSTAQMNNRQSQKARMESDWRKWNSFAPQKAFCGNPDSSRCGERVKGSRKYPVQPAFVSPTRNAPARL